MTRSIEDIRNPVVRQWMETFENDPDAFRRTLHPDVEWFPIEENLARYSGIDGAMLNRERWFDTWAEHEFELEEVVERDDDVVVGVHITAKGRTSGVAVDIRFYAQFQVRDGKVVLIYDHRDREAALEAAGLAP